MVLGGDCLATDSVIFPRSIHGWDGNDLTLADVGTSLYGVLVNKTRDKMELIQIDSSTLSTYATSGITILKRGLPFFVDGSATDLIEVAENKLNWSVGDILRIGTNAPSLYRKIARLYNAATPTLADDLVTKAYADSLAYGGNIDRVIVSGNAGEVVASGDIVYFDETAKEWKLADASVVSTSENIMLGIAQGAGSDGVNITGGVLIKGLDSTHAGMTIGDVQYLSDTSGGISASPGTVQVELGFASTATTLVFNPRFKFYLTQAWKDALAGQSGTALSGTNKVVDAADVTTAKTANRVARRDANGDVLVATTPTSDDAAVSKTWANANLVPFDSSIGVNNGYAYFTNLIPIAGDIAAVSIGWVAASGATLGVAGASLGMGGLSEVKVGTTAVASIVTSLGYGSGTTKNINLKFVANFTNGAGAESYYFAVGTAAPSGAIAADSLRLWYDKDTSKIAFATRGSAAGTTSTDLSAVCSPGTSYLFEIIHTAGVSTVLKINGTVRATHDTADNIPNSATTCGIYIGRSAGTTGAKIVGKFSSIITNLQL